MAVKENSADIMQREKLELERQLSPVTKICDTVITVLFCLIIGGAAIFHIITPDKSFSEKENRALETFPKFTVEALFSGEYAENMTEYLWDHFPLRDTMVEIKAKTEKIALRMENNGIIFGDDSLTARLENPDTENIQSNFDSANIFAKALSEKGINTVFGAAPRRVDVCTQDLPESYGEASQNKLWDFIDLCGKDFSGNYVNIRNRLHALNYLGSELFYRTDHHWNTTGAYYGYSDTVAYLTKSLETQFIPRTLQNFSTETVTEDFYGTSYSASGASWVTPDEIVLMRFEGDDTVPVKIADTGETYEGLYRMEYLDGADKYSVFLGENAGRVDIGYGNREKIVIIKDSFANSVVPFFAKDFDVVMIDPRYFSGSIYRTVLEESPMSVLIMMNADTLSSDDVLKVLERGIK